MNNYWYTVNGISGIPRQEITDYIAAYFEQKQEKVVVISDPKGTTYGQHINDLIVSKRMKVSSFTEALLYLTCSKELCDQTNFNNHSITIAKGSFLENFGYQNQLSDWTLEDAKKIFSLFTKHIQDIYPLLSIILTEDYITAEKRAGENFEYKGNPEKYLIDSNRFLNIKKHPIITQTGMKLINIEIKSRDPWTVFKDDIEPVL